MDTIMVLDFGSQTSQLIARRIREAHVFSELYPWDATPEISSKSVIKGFILSGGPASVYEPGAPTIPDYVLESGLPILGICYGMQALTHRFHGSVAPAAEREYGSAMLEVTVENPLLNSSTYKVWMSHGDRIAELPEGFAALGRSDNSPICAIGDIESGYYGLQFHPEVHHTPDGPGIIRNFVIDICHAAPEWTPDSIIHEEIVRVQERVGDQSVISAVSGGVDSSVATALVHKAIGSQLTAIFVDTGMLRSGEVEKVRSALGKNLGAELININAADKFLKSLTHVTDPEEKRRVIGELFIRTFEEQARKVGNVKFLVQGTIYPDVVESSAPDRSKARKIKSHHNVGGLPQRMHLELVEPLRYLFKDEVRIVGEELGLPPELVWRQPFPGPGLAVRCLGEITESRLKRLRAADAILVEELETNGVLKSRPYDLINGQLEVAQAFAVLLPVHSVGVMGDQRTYQECIAIRAVSSEDFMTADWAKLPHELLERISNRIVNEVDGVNRVVYDITSKPPATIEWE